MSEYKQIIIKDLPKEIKDELINLVAPYAIGLVAIQTKDKVEDGFYLGSGTLVNISGFYCILTAGHVIKNRAFDKADIIGLSFSANVRRYGIERNRIRTEFIWNSENLEFGPDIGLIFIPPDKLPWIKEMKFFWNIMQNKDAVLNIGHNNGAWGTCGCVSEMVTFKENEEGHSKVFSFYHNLWLTGIEKEFSKNGYDYFDTSVAYIEGEEYVPKNFGGLSGGGLWQIPLYEKENKIICGDPLLSGVVFYQSSIENNKRFIRCHGRKSIYENLLKLL